MSNDDTPPHQMPAHNVITLDVLAERLSNFRDEFNQHRKDWRKFVDAQNANEKVQSEAIGRCGRWGKDIEAVRNTELPALSNRVSDLESGSKLASSTAERTVADAVAPSWGRMDWISFFSGLGALITVIATLILGALK